MQYSLSNNSRTGSKANRYISKALKALEGLRFNSVTIVLNEELTQQGLSEEAKKQLAQNVAGKKTRWGQCKLMVVGEGRAGKTQTIRSLIGDEFQGGDASISTLAGEIDLVQTHINGGFSRLGEDDKFQVGMRFYEMARSEAQSKEPSKRKEKKIWNMLPTRKPKPEPSRDQTKDMSQVRAEKLILDKEVQSKVDDNSDSRLTFTIWDFGGQDVFKAIHHLFLSDDGVYILVFDMAKLLRPKDEVESKANLTFWFKSIEMHSKKAPLVIVGTHLDECNIDILNVDDILQETIPEAIRGNVAKYVLEGQDLLFFPVDNQRLDGSDLSVFGALRATVVEKANSLQSVTRDDIPMRWLLYLDTIRERKNEKPTKDLDEMLSDLTDFSIVGEEADQMLDFFHKMGTMLHWNDVGTLKGTVVLNPQWLIDATARIVHNRDFHEGYLNQDVLKRKKNMNMYNKMHTTGIIDRALMENVLWVDGNFKHRIDFLLALYEQMLLLCEYGNNSFIVPSLLQNLDATAQEGLEKEVQKRWGESQALLKSVTMAEAVIKFSWLPAGLFERFACVCAKNDTTFGVNSVIFEREIDGIGHIPVRFKSSEVFNSIEITLCSLEGVPTLKIASDIYETIASILEDMRLTGITTDLLLVGEDDNRFDVSTLGKVKKTTLNVKNTGGKSVEVTALGSWYEEKMRSESGTFSGPSLRWNFEDRTGKLTPDEFAEKATEWKHKWERVVDQCEVAMTKGPKKEEVYRTLQVLIDGPMKFIADIWKDALKHAGGTKVSVADYKKHITAFVEGNQCMKTIDKWITHVFDVIQDLVTKQHRYGIFLSHQGMKTDSYGELRSNWKFTMDTIRTMYQKELKFMDGEQVPIFFDRKMLPGDNQYESMLFTVCKTDKIFVFIDKEFFTKKWCLMEYFLAKQRPEAMMPFLIDNPVTPIDLPEGMVYQKLDENFRHDDIIVNLQQYFGKRNRADYTDRL